MIYDNLYGYGWNAIPFYKMQNNKKNFVELVETNVFKLLFKEGLLGRILTAFKPYEIADLQIYWYLTWD